MRNTQTIKRKKINVQKLIDDLFSCLTIYIFIIVKFWVFMFHESFRLKSQILFFQTFIFFALLEIIVKHINMKIDIERNKKFKHEKT